MKKQLLIGILSIGVVGLLMGAGTFAYFTSGETVTGNTFTAGTLVVDFNPVGTTLPLTLGPAEPGVWSEQYQVNVYNRMASTMKAKYKRVLLKLSGEAFSGKKAHGIDAGICAHLAKQIKEVVDLKVVN